MFDALEENGRKKLKCYLYFQTGKATKCKIQYDTLPNSPNNCGSW